MGRGRLDWSRQVQVLPLSDHYGIQMNSTCQYVIIVKECERDANFFFCSNKFSMQVAMRFLLLPLLVVGLCWSNFNLLRSQVLPFATKSAGIGKGWGCSELLGHPWHSNSTSKTGMLMGKLPEETRKKNIRLLVVSLFSTWKHTTWLDICGTNEIKYIKYY